MISEFAMVYRLRHEEMAVMTNVMLIAQMIHKNGQTVDNLRKDKKKRGNRAEWRTHDEKTWICPSAKTGEESYKFLPEAFGKKMSDFKEPDKTPIATCQQHDNTLYADGHVEMK